MQFGSKQPVEEIAFARIDLEIAIEGDGFG
jgi:hypothetical protein